MTDLEEKIRKLNFGIEKSMRYHQRRRAFYEWTHNGIMLLIFMLGSVAFSDVLQEWSRYFVASATVLAGMDLVWKFSHRSRDHELLFRRFSTLAIDLRTGTDSDDNYAKWAKERVTIEADEPPIYWALEADCHNEVSRLVGNTLDLLDIGPWHRWTMNILRHADTPFQPPKSARLVKSEPAVTDTPRLRF